MGYSFLSEKEQAEADARPEKKESRGLFASLFGKSDEEKDDDARLLDDRTDHVEKALIKHKKGVENRQRTRDSNFNSEFGLGTVSLNEQRTRGVEVLVREGIVDVANASGAIAPTRLQANHRALANRTHGIRIESVAHDDLDHQLAWREGMLSFNGDTLSVAAAQFLRYSDVRIMIDDPLVGSRRIVGLYSANDPIGFARSVALSLGLAVEQEGNDVWLRAPHNAAYSAPRSLQ